MMNIMNGGKHAAGATDLQEFMIMPVGADQFCRRPALGRGDLPEPEEGADQEGYRTTVGDEGGFAPQVSANARRLT